MGASSGSQAVGVVPMLGADKPAVGTTPARAPLLLSTAPFPAAGENG